MYRNLYKHFRPCHIWKNQNGLSVDVLSQRQPQDVICNFQNYSRTISTYGSVFRNRSNVVIRSRRLSAVSPVLHNVHSRYFTAEINESKYWTMENIEDRLFDTLCDSEGYLSISKFKLALKSSGLRPSDPRLKETMENLSRFQAQVGEMEGVHSIHLDRNTFKRCVSENKTLIARAFHNNFIIPDFTSFSQSVEDLYYKVKANTDGKVASYIPQLARYSRDFWAVSICTIDGQRFSIGDVDIPVCLQSVSKPLTYALALNELSPEVVHQYVGHEPSGRQFNEIKLGADNKPHNPMINAGAIVLCSLLKQDSNLADRFDYTSNMFKKLAGNEHLSFNNSVFLSERETADRNFALGYYLREYKCFPKGTNLMDTLDFYFQLCSVEVTCDSGSVIAASLANGGICPTTGEKILNLGSVRNTLSLMHSCGMYDYSGQFAFDVGLPSKSGVSGSVMLVIPNVMGIYLWAPPIDPYGNSCKGLQFCEELVYKYNFHHYDSLRHTQRKLDPRIQEYTNRAEAVVQLLFASQNNDITALRRCFLSGMNMNQTDYDGRTALHVASADGHLETVQFLIERCNASPSAVDRWNHTALDDAKKFGKQTIIDYLEKYMTENLSTSQSEGP